MRYIQFTRASRDERLHLHFFLSDWAQRVNSRQVASILHEIRKGYVYSWNLEAEE